MSFKLDDEFRDKNRRHTSQERKTLERLIAKHGCAPGALTVAVIGAARLLCDGYTTNAICEEQGLPTTPPVEIAFATREEVLQWIHDRQRARRNLTPEQMAENRALRVEEVVELRSQGMSTHEIAEKVGTSQKTVVKDLDKAVTDTGVSVEPPEGKITGKDGRKQPAKRKPKGKKKGKRISPSPHSGNVGQSFDEQFEKLYDAILLVIDRRAQAMGKDKCYTLCIHAAFECRKQYKAWVSA